MKMKCKKLEDKQENFSTYKYSEKEIKKEKVPTELVAYPCPKCGKYYVPYMHTKDGYALMICEEHGQYKTSVQVSANFRKFCSKVGSAPNRDPHYYTSSEEKILRFLRRRGLIEGLDFTHNTRIGPFINEKGHKVFYWVDFIIPQYKLILEASPQIWHKMWNREKADERKAKFLTPLGWKVIHLDEKDLNQLNKKRKKSKYPKTENVKEIYRIFNCSEEYEIENGEREKGIQYDK